MEHTAYCWSNIASWIIYSLLKINSIQWPLVKSQLWCQQCLKSNDLPLQSITSNGKAPWHDWHGRVAGDCQACHGTFQKIRCTECILRCYQRWLGHPQTKKKKWRFSAGKISKPWLITPAGVSVNIPLQREVLEDLHGYFGQHPSKTADWTIPYYSPVQASRKLIHAAGFNPSKTHSTNVSCDQASRWIRYRIGNHRNITWNYVPDDYSLWIICIYAYIVLKYTSWFLLLNVKKTIAADSSPSVGCPGNANRLLKGVDIAWA